MDNFVMLCCERRCLEVQFALQSNPQVFINAILVC
jgi:hypothetical protein